MFSKTSGSSSQRYATKESLRSLAQVLVLLLQCLRRSTANRPFFIILANQALLFADEHKNATTKHRKNDIQEIPRAQNETLPAQIEVMSNGNLWPLSPHLAGWKPSFKAATCSRARSPDADFKFKNGRHIRDTSEAHHCYSYFCLL